MLVAVLRGHLACAAALSSFGASRVGGRRLAVAEEPRLEAEAVAETRGWVELHAWLVRSRGWTPLHHLEQLTAARASSLLRAGASVRAPAASGSGAASGAVTPLERARAILQTRAAEGEGAEAGAAAAALVLQADAPWTPHSHHLFPAAVRARAVELLWLGAAARHSRRLPLEVWRAHVMPHLLLRDDE